MSGLMLIAFGLVALGSVIRLVLFFTRAKDKAGMDVLADGVAGK